MGNKVARREIAMIEVAGQQSALRIMDDAIQAFETGGLEQSYISKRN